MSEEFFFLNITDRTSYDHIIKNNICIEFTFWTGVTVSLGQTHEK